MADQFKFSYRKKGKSKEFKQSRHKTPIVHLYKTKKTI